MTVNVVIDVLSYVGPRRLFCFSFSKDLLSKMDVIARRRFDQQSEVDDRKVPSGNHLEKQTTATSLSSPRGKDDVYPLRLKGVIISNF